MKEKDVHQFIEQQNKETKEAYYADFQKKHNLYANKSVRVTKKHIARMASYAAVLVALCLTVVLPFLIKNDEQNPIRFCSVSDCVPKDMDCTVQQYANDQGLPLLYINWYDMADDIRTTMYVSKDNNDDIIYIQETIVNGETGEFVHLQIVNQSINVDLLTFHEESCGETTEINGTSVNWAYRRQVGRAYFVYKGYKYYIELEEPMDEEAVLAIVEEMIP